MNISDYCDISIVLFLIVAFKPDRVHYSAVSGMGFKGISSSLIAKL